MAHYYCTEQIELQIGMSFLGFPQQFLKHVRLEHLILDQMRDG